MLPPPKIILSWSSSPFLSLCGTRHIKDREIPYLIFLPHLTLYSVVYVRKKLKSLTMEEKSVLKLVHPGRFVEIHTQPIAAAEVLRKNPRHCITSPDVFRNPCFVMVRPEAVLRPGKVFLIVPNRTIYRLLKASKCCKESAPLPQYDPPRASVNWFPQQSSPLRACAGMTPRCKSPKAIPLPRNGVKSPWDQDSDKNLRRPPSLAKQSWGRVLFAQHRHSHHELEREPLLGSVGETTTYHAEENSPLINKNNASHPKTKELRCRQCEQAK